MNQPSPILLALAILFCPSVVCAQDTEGDVRKKLEELESRVLRLESRNDEVERNQRKLLKESGAIVLISVLFGTVCALWAQNTGRSSYLWFFFGVLFNFVAVWVLLSKNAASLRRQRRQAAFK